MKILVTGATGFVGGAVVRRLAAVPGIDVFAGGRSAEGPDLPPGAVPVAFDICEPESFGPARRSGPFDAVVHSAGLAHQFRGGTAEDFEAVNVRGTENVCRLAVEAGAKRFIHISSVAVYGAYGKTPVDEEFECRPRGPYAESKLASERAVADVFGSGSLILRLATVVGPGDAGNTARLITNIARRRFYPVGDGSNLKTFVSVSDAAETVCRLVDPGVFRPGVFNVAAPAVSVREVVGTIYSALGRRFPRFFIPTSLVEPFLALNRSMFRIGSVLRAGELLEKWLADDIYSGDLLARSFGIAQKRSVLEEIRAEASAMAGK